MFKRQIIGNVAMLLGAVSLYSMFKDYNLEPILTSLPTWAWNLMSVWVWAWLVISFMAICFMIFKVNSPLFAQVATFMFVVQTAVAICDVLVTKGPPSDLTFVQFVLHAIVILGWPAINVLDVELLSQINEAARPKSDLDKAIENAM